MIKMLYPWIKSVSWTWQEIIGKLSIIIQNYIIIVILEGGLTYINLSVS